MLTILQPFIISLLAAMTLGSLGYSQSVIKVPQDVATIQGAMNLAAPGDVVDVAPGTYFETISFTEGVRLRGAGPAQTIIDGMASTTPVVTINAAPSSCRCSSLSGFTIRNGNQGIYADGGNLAVIDCAVTGNGAALIGGANYGGGIVASFSTVDLIRVRVAGNFSPFDGAGVRGAPVALRMVDCDISNNIAMLSGGGISMRSSSLFSATNCVISGNVAGTNGGGVLLDGEPDVPVTMERCTIASNTAPSLGGGIYVAKEFPLNLRDSIVWSNTPSGVALSVVPGANAIVNAASCNTQVLLPGFGNISLDPLFTNPLANDFSLGAGSPCIGIGNPSELNPNGTLQDMGRVAYFPALSAGARGNSGAIPHSLVQLPPHITINGSNGGLAGRVDVSPNTPLSIDVAAYGFIGASAANPIYLDVFQGVADASTEAMIEGLGGFAFLPSVLTPSSTDRFTLVDSIFSTFSSAVTPAATAPWSLTLPAGLPVTGQFTLQAVMLGGPIPGYGGAFLRSSRATILNIR